MKDWTKQPPLLPTKILEGRAAEADLLPRHSARFKACLLLLMIAPLIACDDFLTKNVYFGGARTATGVTTGDTTDDSTDSGQADDDADGLGNQLEKTLFSTSTIADTDGDGYADGLEYVSANGDPLNNQAIPSRMVRSKVTTSEPTLTREVDSDLDGLSDSFESLSNIDPLDPDSDGDGFGDALELVARSDPRVATSRPTRARALVDDGVAVGIPPLDSDKDGLSDAVEIQQRSLADQPDSDGDGYSDGIEYLMGSQLSNKESIPNFET